MDWRKLIARMRHHRFAHTAVEVKTAPAIADDDSLILMESEKLTHQETEWARVVDPITQEELLVPAFSTVEATIARSAKRRAGELHTIRFFPDHGHPWPLWDSQAGYTATPDDYGLSDQLDRALRRWYDEWEAAVGPGDGWREMEQYIRWAARGDELAAWLAQEVWDTADVVVEHRTG
ncbi:hypothetical protein ATY41_04425 [Leifsonia xyli subsp. xyli]|uniref:Uncharacterized protein n=1 Tax=Leifsonia xyli subsp. xyli TaxID=59736 RepID=A0A1E2SIZ7_LEIXY|nr:hypothetical protein [Leifsonia xyli]ODA89701.1 hypothetical protein ATY41_04425 [Leifsonia xyli subsp. xyli]